MRKFTILGIFVVIAGIFLFRSFFYIDRSSGCKIFILPSVLEFNNGTVIDALHLLKRTAPDAHEMVCENVTKINPNFSCGGSLWGGCFRGKADRSDQKTIDISTSHKDILWTASIIVHEACHARQYANVEEMSEDQCYSEGYQIVYEIVRP